MVSYLKVTSARFLKSGTAPAHFPACNAAEAAFIGRSNVGKSSVLNSLLGMKGLARVGSQPGRTRLINFYLVNERYYFVDLPGYGYARVSREERKRWKNSVESYLNLRRVTIAVLLVDARIGPQEGDLMMLEWLKDQQVPWLMVLTKSDKLSRTKLANQRRAYASNLAMAQDLLLPFSIKTGQGRKELNVLLAKAFREASP